MMPRNIFPPDVRTHMQTKSTLNTNRKIFPLCIFSQRNSLSFELYLSRVFSIVHRKWKRVCFLYFIFLVFFRLNYNRTIILLTDSH